MPDSVEGNKLGGKGISVYLQLDKMSKQQLFYLKSEGETDNGEDE